MFDADLVRRHLHVLRQTARRLRVDAGNPLHAMASSRDEQWVVERGLQLCALSTFDIATHIGTTADRGASDYATAIDELARLGILPADLASRLRAPAGFRSQIVHGDLDVDTRSLHSLLDERLSDFEEFADHVDVLVDSAEG